MGHYANPVVLYTCENMYWYSAADVVLGGGGRLGCLEIALIKKLAMALVTLY